MATASLIDGPMEAPQVEADKQFDASLLEGIPEPMAIASLGQGLKLTKRAAVEMDHAFCNWLLELTPFDPDRTLDDRHVVELNQAMQRGTFLPETVQIITCVLGGKEYRMNGQHTAWARWNMPQGYRCPIQHMRYKAETDNDMRRLYSSIDRNKPRTTGNVIVAYLYGTPEWAGTSKAVLKRLSEGMAFWKWDGQQHRARHDADDRALMLMTDHYDLARKVAAFLDEASLQEGRHIIRRPVVAAMFATFGKAGQASREFWAAVRDGVGFADKDDPRLRLRNALISASIDTGRGASEEKKSVGTEEMYRWCLSAWNAWRNGQPLRQQPRAMMGNERPRVV